MHGVTYPRIGKVEAMANYFGCEKSDLIEEKVPKETSDKIDLATDILIRMESDHVFSELVQSLYYLDTKKLSSIKLMLDSLTE